MNCLDNIIEELKEEFSESLIENIEIRVEPFCWAASADPLTKEIEISPHFLETYEKNVLKAVILHEIGHLKDPSNSFVKTPPDMFKFTKDMLHATEFFADAFAASHGYGNSLIKYLKDNKLKDESMTHPSDYDRIKAIKNKINEGI